MFCKDDHSTSISTLKSMGYEKDEIDEILKWFNENGGYCDCEASINILISIGIITHAWQSL